MKRAICGGIYLDSRHCMIPTTRHMLSKPSNSTISSIVWKVPNSYQAARQTYYTKQITRLEIIVMNRPMKHVDRKDLYTDLESRIEYLHSFLDFSSRTLIRES